MILTILTNMRSVNVHECYIASVMSDSFATLWNVAHQVPLSMGFSRQKNWSGLPCPSPADLPNLGIEHMSLTSPAVSGGFFTTSTTWEALRSVNIYIHTWNIHTLNSFHILGKDVVIHYTDLCGWEYLDKAGGKCTRRKRTYIQAWDPELDLQMGQCTHSTSGSGSLQMKSESESCSGDSLQPHGL